MDAAAAPRIQHPRSHRLAMPFARLALAALAAALLLGDLAAARPLRVLTYNIHHARGRDGRYDLERIAGVINDADPDLVALQEVDQGTTRSGPGDMQLDELARLTGMQGRFGKAINRHGGEYGNGVLVAPDVAIRQVLNHALPNPADGEPRRVMQLRLQYDEQGDTRRVDFFATHFDHSSGANRRAQMEFVNDLVEGSTIPAIFAGDFNFDDEGPAYRMLREQWLDPTAAHPGRPHQIDYVVYRAADQWTVERPGRFIVNETTADASDHYPLLAVLELAPHTADFNADGAVDGADLLAWQRNLGAAGGTIPGDANHDHVVSGADRAIWTQQFGLGPAAHAIPEPGSGALLGPLAALLAGALLPRSATVSAANTSPTARGRAFKS